MESKFIVNSIGIGGVFFVGMIVFWFVFVYLKKRVTSDQSNSGYAAAAKISWEEKRQYPRVEISWQASLENSNPPQEIRLRDISLGGAFVICQEPLALQDQFKITINLPDREPLQLNAEVVWSNASMPLEKVVYRGMGVRFIKNEEEKRQQLQDAISAALEKTVESGAAKP
jgi:Tfp pilus assembly protein PilZ